MDINYNRYLNLQPGQARGGLPINYNSEPWRETEQFEGLLNFTVQLKSERMSTNSLLKFGTDKADGLVMLKITSRRTSPGRQKLMLQMRAVSL